MHQCAPLTVLAAALGLFSLFSSPLSAADRSSRVVLASDGALVEVLEDRALTPEEIASQGSGSYATAGESSGCGSGACGGQCGNCGSQCGACGGRCGKQKGKLLCLLRGLQNEENWFNCECNGSYKFPVPPLFTYHWPGLYSQQLMTDYHSPWRFLPIKPYEDEDPLDLDPSAGASHRQSHLHPVAQRTRREISPIQSTSEPASVGFRGVEPVSAKIRRRYGG